MISCSTSACWRNWKSPAARREFPGLQASAERLRGRYGIGFFSVFMWATDVRIFSRRFNDALPNAMALEFREGLESRPLLKSAESAERSSKWSTKVRLTVPREIFSTLASGAEKEDEERSVLRARYRGMPVQVRSWSERIKRLCGPLEINVYLETAAGIEPVSLPNWRDCDTVTFLNFFGGALFQRDPRIDRFANSLTVLSEPAPLGGRCFISPSDGSSGSIGVYEKGIFVNDAYPIGYHGNGGIFGIIQAKVFNAARDRATALPIARDERWIANASAKAFHNCINIGEQLAIQRILMELDSLDPNQPIFICNREFRTLNQVREKIRASGFFRIRLVEDVGENQFTWKAADRLNVITAMTVDEGRVYPLVNFSGIVPRDSDPWALIERGGEPVFRLLRDFTNLLGDNPDLVVDYQEVSGYREDYIELTARRAIQAS